MPIPVADVRTITEAVLANLVGIAENETLDFKRESYGASDAEKRELCKDISAMANSQGGDIVLGVAEQDHAASEVVGLDIIVGDEIQRLQNISQMAIEPRVSGFRFHAVPLANGKHVIVLRVPQSMDTPHRVTHGGTNKFWVRRTTDTFEASLQELRQMFERSSDEFERAEAFISERMSKLYNDTEPFPLSGKSEGFAALHMVPFGFQKRKAVIDLSALETDFGTFDPIGTSNAHRLYVADGFVSRRGDQNSYGYTAVMRTGALEATKARLFSVDMGGGRVVAHAPNLRQDLRTTIPRYLSGFARYGLHGPWLVGLTLGTCINKALMVPRGPYQEDASVGAPLLELSLSFPLVVIDGNATAPQIDDALQPIFDAMWQAAGLAACSEANVPVFGSR